MDDFDKYRLVDSLFNVYLDSQFEEEDKSLFGPDDIEEIVDRNVMLFKQLRTQTKAEINKIKHDRVLSFLATLREGIRADMQEYKDLADRILAKPKFAALQPMFRNYESSSEEDRKSVAYDSELLDMLSEIEEEYNRDIEGEN